MAASRREASHQWAYLLLVEDQSYPAEDHPANLEADHLAIQVGDHPAIPVEGRLAILVVDLLVNLQLEDHQTDLP